MNGLYKSLIVEKLSTHICHIRYKSGIYSFEKPFKLADNRQLYEIYESDFIILLDCVTNNTVTLYFDDILMFRIDHEGNQEESQKALQSELEEYQKVFGEFKFLRSQRLHELFFRTDYEEPKKTRIRNLKIMDGLQLDSLDDYTSFLLNKPEIVERLRKVWLNLILAKYNDTVKSIDEEIKGANEDVVTELQAIKDILASIQKEAEDELATKKTCEEVLTYWPTLLLPRSPVFDMS